WLRVFLERGVTPLEETRIRIALKEADERVPSGLRETPDLYRESGMSRGARGEGQVQVLQRKRHSPRHEILQGLGAASGLPRTGPGTDEQRGCGPSASKSSLPGSILKISVEKMGGWPVSPTHAAPTASLLRSALESDRH